MELTGTRQIRDIAHYFEYSGVGLVVEEDGLREVQFGEFLVERGVITRAQLFQALCMQDQSPGVRLGEIVSALGFTTWPNVDRLLTDFYALRVVEVDV
jgi:hypothetical protein